MPRGKGVEQMQITTSRRGRQNREIQLTHRNAIFRLFSRQVSGIFCIALKMEGLVRASRSAERPPQMCSIGQQLWYYYVASSIARDLRDPLWKLEASRLALVGTIWSKASDLFFGLIRVDKAYWLSYTYAVALSSCMCVIREVFPSPEQRTTDRGSRERPKWGASPAKP
jgi:hypothetical protein